MKNKNDFFYDNHCPMLICKNDKYSTIIEANNAFYCLVGYSRNEMERIYNNHFSSLVIDDVSKILDKVKLTIKCNNVLNYEFRIKNKLGKTIWIHDIATYDSKTDTFFVTIMDITYRQNQLELIEKRVNYDNLILWLSSLIDNLPTSIAIFDCKGNKIIENRSFKYLYDDILSGIEISSCERDSFIKITSMSFICDIYQGEKLLEIGRKSLRIKHQAIAHPSENNEYHMLVIDDVSSLKIKEKELMHALAVRNDFLAVVNHELRTPISAILGLLELLNNNVSNPINRKIIINAQESAHRLKLHVNDILDFSKLESTQIQLEKEFGNVYYEIGPLLRKFEIQVNEKGLDFRINWKPSPYAEMKFDWARLNKIISNIVSNAIKFTSEGCINISIYVEQKRLYINITDTGCGIDEDDLSTLFVPFSQVNQSINRQHGGTGLGLSIVKRLVDVMKGEISVISGVGVGTSVSVDLPIDAAPIAVVGTKPLSSRDADVNSWLRTWGVNTEKKGCNSGTHIIQSDISNYPDVILKQLQSDCYQLCENVSCKWVLVITEDQVSKSLLKKKIDCLGFEVKVFSDVKSAIGFLRESLVSGTVEKIEFLLFDLAIISMSGKQFSKLIRSNYYLSSVSVIFFNSDVSLIDKNALNEESKNMNVIYKPYHLKELRKIMV